MLVEEINEITDLDDLHEIINKVTDINILSRDEGAGKNNALIFLKNVLYNLLIKRKKDIKSSDVPKIHLKRTLSREYPSKTKIWKIFNRFPYTNRDLGAVPRVFLTDVDNKKECAKKLFDLFGKYSLILNYDYTHELELTHVKMNCNIANFTKELSELIKKPVKVTVAGHGFFGNGFKITISEENKVYDFFYKAFYPHDSRHKHGADVEILYAYFASKNSTKKQFVKFHMGRLGTPFEKDAFLLTQFLKKDSNYKRNPILNINYVESHDKRIENTINGRIVDFGGVAEEISELKDRKLRKTVRIVLRRLKKKVDTANIIYNWQMCKKNASNLKKYVEKIDFESYLKALNIIEKNITVLPNTVFEDLKNIKNWDDEYSMDVTRALHTEDIITCDINKLKHNIRTLNVKIKTSLDGAEDHFGYIILDLFHDRQVVYFLNKDNDIIRIRLEKIVNKTEFVTLLELFGAEEINAYKNDNIVELINS